MRRARPRTGRFSLRLDVSYWRAPLPRGPRLSGMTGLDETPGGGIVKWTSLAGTAAYMFGLDRKVDK